MTAALVGRDLSQNIWPDGFKFMIQLALHKSQIIRGSKKDFLSLEKNLNMKGCLEKSLEIKSALNSIGDSQDLENNLNFYCFSEDINLLMENQIRLRGYKTFSTERS